MAITTTQIDGLIDANLPDNNTRSNRASTVRALLKVVTGWVRDQVNVAAIVWLKVGTTTTPGNNTEDVYRIGKVGIGTNTPTEQLEVNGVVKSQGLKVVAGTFNSIYSGNTDTTYPPEMTIVGAARLSVGANWVPGISDLALINSNVSSNSISFWSMPTATTKKLLGILRDGFLGIGTIAPSSSIHVIGTNGHSQFRLEQPYTPTGTSDANGATGQVAWDANFVYVKTAAGWKRSALTTF